jgi:hypothetical protein
MKKARTLRELFSFPGFINKRQLEGQFGDPKARTIVLERKKKPQSAQAATPSTKIIMIEKFVACVTAMLKAIAFIFAMKDGEYIVENVMVFEWKH